MENAEIYSGLTNERMVVCPYDPSHLILHYRFITHLVDCKKNFPHISMKHCMFNLTRVFPAEKEQHHLRTCKDCLKDKLETPSNLPPVVGTVSMSAIPMVDAGSEWDDEIKEQPISTKMEVYEKAYEKPVIIPIQGATKKQRKLYTMKERRRLYNLNQAMSGNP